MRLLKNDIPIKNLDDWYHLAPPKDPIQQWVDNRSAKEEAKSWLEASPGVPTEIEMIFSNSYSFGDVRFQTGEPEYQIHFDAYRGPRNADMAIWAEDDRGKIGITIEAKADESFDRLVKEYYSDAIEERIKKPRSEMLNRINELSMAIFGPREPYVPKIGDFRYQLFTAIAGTIVHANMIGANRAVLLIHEFVTDATSRRKLESNHSDLQKFCARLSGDSHFELQSRMLYGPFDYPGIPLYPAQPKLFIGKAVCELGEPGA